jgi:hypothetical protein
MGAKGIVGDSQRLFNLHLALIMECLHSGAIGLCVHLELIITNEQNNDSHCLSIVTSGNGHKPWHIMKITQ